jgi:hypothetical protein
MGLQGSLQFALLAIGLAEVLDQLRVTLVHVRHRDVRLLITFIDAFSYPALFW